MFDFLLTLNIGMPLFLFESLAPSLVHKHQQDMSSDFHVVGPHVIQPINSNIIVRSRGESKNIERSSH